jgi:hypothetical protein
MAATVNPTTVVMQKIWGALLSKAVIRRSHSISLTKLNQQLAIQSAFDQYVIHVLEAPPEIRDQVRAAMAEDLREAGEDAINLSWGGAIMQILTGFEILPDDNTRFLFIATYKTAATVGAQGSHLAVRPHVVNPGHIPPGSEP